jgi:hypothetical protein
MKKGILLIIIAICCLAACKKTSVSPGLFGKWELRNEAGGIAGIDSAYKAGNGTVLQLNSDSTYQHYIKGKLYNQGTFHVEMVYPPSGPYDEIFYDGNTSGQYLKLNGTQLVIGTDYDDGMAATYQKISD